MSQPAIVNENIRRAAKVLELGERIEQLLLNPSREVKVELAIELHNGQVATFSGYSHPAQPCPRANEGRITLSSAR